MGILARSNHGADDGDCDCDSSAFFPLSPPVFRMGEKEALAGDDDDGDESNGSEPDPPAIATGRGGECIVVVVGVEEITMPGVGERRSIWSRSARVLKRSSALKKRVRLRMCERATSSMSPSICSTYRCIPTTFGEGARGAPLVLPRALLPAAATAAGGDRGRAAVADRAGSG